MNILIKSIPSSWWIWVALWTTACQPKASKESSPPPERIQEWYQSLERSVAHSHTWTLKRIRTMKREVYITPNEIGSEYIKRAEKLDQQAQVILKILDELKTSIVIQAGGNLNAKTHIVKQALNIKKGRRELEKQWPSIEKQLKAYSAQIREQAQDLPGLKINCNVLALGKQFDGMNFYQVYFEGASVPEILMGITTLQVKVITCENNVIRKFGFDGSPI